MKIAIISDTHDNHYTLNKALKYIAVIDCDFLIHAGDLARPETLDLIATKFHKPIYIVGGNADINIDEIKSIATIHPNIFYKKEYLEIEIDNIKIAVTHTPNSAKILAQGSDYDLVIHGHDHKPWQSHIGKTEILNPGNLQDTGYPATFAIYDTITKKPELIIINKL